MTEIVKANVIETSFFAKSLPNILDSNEGLILFGSCDDVWIVVLSRE